MKGAFVLQMTTDLEVDGRNFAGCVEEVDTGAELKFRSSAELIDFLRECVAKVEGREGRQGQERLERQEKE